MRDIGKIVAECEDIRSGRETETLLDHWQPVKFACPVCNKVYVSHADAEDCRDQSYEDGGLKVGDIMVVPGKWRNDYSLDDPWLAFEIPPDLESRSHFDHSGYRVPYYVVTAIHKEWRNKHRCVVTLATLCGGNLHVGFNPADGNGHYAMFRIDGHRCDIGSTWIDTIKDLLATCDPPESVRKEAAGLAAIGISTRNLL